MTQPDPAVADVYLRTYLAPLQDLLDRPDVSDIFVNRPGEVWAETRSGAIERHARSALDETALWRLARQMAGYSHQGVTRTHPVLGAALPGGARVQLVAPPVSRTGLAMAIRKPSVTHITLAQLARVPCVSARSNDADPRPAIVGSLAAGDLEGALRAMVHERLNMVICGGTASGKTTFANGLIREIPEEARLIYIEDVAELQLTHPNSLGLVAVRGGLGEASISLNDLLEASLRMRPDRIILGELRGAEAFTFLRAANTGHPGSITTLHADSVSGALSQMSLMLLQGGLRLDRFECEHYIRQVVDVWIQLERREGVRRVANIRLEPREAGDTV